MRFGTVAIVGRSNVGKSTFLNAALGERLAIVSHLPQTTRDTLLGVAQRGEAQIAFMDTPGLHRPQSELGRRMNAVAVEAARSADVIVFMTDTRLLTRKDAGAADEDRLLLDALPADASSVLVINKIDLLRDKSKLLPFIERYTNARNFVAVVPVSLLDEDDVERLLREIIAHLPEGAAGYDDETLTDRPTTFFIREYIREQVLLQIGREVPHAVAVSIDEVDDRGHIWLLKATIHVEKVGQRKILIGSGGRQIRALGIAARERIEQLIERKVHLELFVRVTPRWKDVTRQLAEFGYESHGKRSDLRAPVTRQQKRGGQK